MSDENVGGLVELPAKWRLRMAHADAMEKSCADEANKNWWSGVSQQAEECADELEAALSVSESKICGLAERMSELIYRAERSGYVVIKHDEIRRISTALSAHGQPVDYSPALHSVLSYIAYGECDEEGLHPGLFATVKEKIDKLHSKPVVDEAMEDRALNAKVGFGGMTVRDYLLDGGKKYWSPSSYTWEPTKQRIVIRAALTAALKGDTP